MPSAGSAATAGEQPRGTAAEALPSWAERAIEHSPSVQVSRRRSVGQARVIVEAARRLVAEKGADFTTRDLIREAGIATQTFYRYFAGKDQLMLAVIEDLLTDVAAALERAAADIEDPLLRLRSHLTRMMLGPREFPPSSPRGAQFMAVERWRLQRAYPAEMDLARKPIVDLIRREIDAATAAGQLDPPGSASSAWFVTELITAVHYHHVFQPAGQPVEQVIEELWTFCLAGLRCAPNRLATVSGPPGVERPGSSLRGPF
jgi:AcrR family transcriptional regulator